MDDRRLSIASSVASQSFEATRKLKNPASRIPSPILTYPEARLKRPGKGPSGEPLRSGRIPRVTRKNQVRPDPKEWYGPPPPRPESWGPKDKGGRPLFKYTECGELERGKTYSQTEMRQYIYGPKSAEHFKAPDLLPGVPVAEGMRRQGLTLWIGWVPAQSNDRYPYDALSQKCRFRDCPEPKNTIRSGFPRVVFDERINVDGEVIDPFHNAGYAHLYCVEKNFDIIGTMQLVNVRPDYRDFKREENLCKLSRQFPNIQEDIEEWYKVQHARYTESKVKGLSRKWFYEDSLSHCLVQHAVTHLPDIRARVRESRAGADISKHLGDLHYQAFLNDCRRFNLLDEFGNPVQNAKEIMENMPKRVRVRPGPRPKQLGPLRIGTPMTPGQNPYGYASPVSYGTPSSMTPSTVAYYDTPMSRAMTPVSVQSYPSSTLQPVPDSGLQPVPASPYQLMGYSHMLPPPVDNSAQLPPPTVDSSAHKRTNDEALAEDQNIGSPTMKQENPPKRPRVEEPAATSAAENAPMWDAHESPVDGPPEMPPPEAGDLDSFAPFDPVRDLEPDMDLETAFNLIDAEMRGELPKGEQQPSVGTSDDLVVEGGDLSSDANETSAVGQPVSLETSPNVRSPESKEDNATGELGDTS